MRLLDGFRRDASALRSALARETVPGTNQSLWPQVSEFWEDTYGSNGLGWSSRMLERVWVVNRCLQLCSQQIASMPLRFEGSFEPAWITSPDPNFFPNGIGDAIFAITWHMYGYGDAFVIVTDRYASGYPRSWSLIHPEVMTVELDDDGRRRYKVQDRPLPRADIVQITRNPTGNLRGTSALAAYATPAWNVVAGAETTNAVLNNLPAAVLKSKHKLTADQALSIQRQWVTRAASRGRGVPPVLPNDLELVATQLGFAPKDLLLLEAQEMDARVLASAFGVPANLLNMAVQGGLLYQNPAQLGEQWWRYELLPGPGKRIADAFTANLLPAGSSVLFDASATFSPLDSPEEGIPAESPVAKASPADQPMAPMSSLNGAPRSAPLEDGNGNGHQPGSSVFFEDGAIRVEAAPTPNVTVEPAAVTVEPANVHIDYHPAGAVTKTVKFSDGRSATIKESAPTIRTIDFSDGRTATIKEEPVT